MCYVVKSNQLGINTHFLWSELYVVNCTGYEKWLIYDEERVFHS